MAVTPQTNATLAEIAAAMRSFDHFVICGHVSPDGDCLGSQLALAHALRALGKRADCILVKDEPVPAAMSFLPGIADMVPAGDYGEEPEVFVGVDVPTRERIGEDACCILDNCRFSITVDHHAAENRMCELAYVDPDSASASMILWELAKLLVDEPPLESAICAYTGLVTDTGGFRFQNSDAAAFAAASELIGYGVQPAEVANHAFQSRSRASLQLESLVIGRMKVFHDGAAVLSYITQEDMERVGAVKSDTEPLIDALRSLAGVRVACFLREQEGTVRGSLRSKDVTDVAALAREIGGGGHRSAAGCTLRMPLEEALVLMEAKIEELLVS